MPRRLHRLAGILSWALWIPAAARPLPAQTVELRLREDSSAVPVVGAIVRLLGGRGVAFQGLTNEAGRLDLRAPDSGSYRIRIDRIGSSGFLTDPFFLGLGETLRRVIPLGSHPVRLPAIEVRANPRCDQPGPLGEAGAVMWDEIQKALTAHLLTAAQGLPLHVKEFVREVDRGGAAQREWIVASRVTRQTPFRSLAPGDLARRGFVYESADTTVFAAPDAALLVSDEFVSTHCFYAREGEHGLAGLGFQPLQGRRLPDVRGTLWLDRETAQLRFLEFFYTGLPGALQRLAYGGRIQFTLLPAGQWIVTNWHVRMPRFEATGTPPGRPHLVPGYLDNGGRVEFATDTTSPAQRAVVTGEVHDSTTGHGLAGARVWLRGTRDSATTDSEGRFQLSVPLSGPQVVAVRHPKLGLLGEPTARGVLLSVGETTPVHFGVPSLAAFTRTYCRNRQRPGRLVLVGTARYADGSPAVGLLVSATDLTHHVLPGVNSAEANRSGTYILCNLPMNDTIRVALRKGKQTRVEEAVVLERESRWLDFVAVSSGGTAQPCCRLPDLVTWGVSFGRSHATPVPSLQPPPCTARFRRSPADRRSHQGQDVSG